MSHHSTKTSRQAILDRLRTKPVSSKPLPDIDLTRMSRFDDSLAKFREMLGFVGGESHLVDSVSQVGDVLADVPEFDSASQVVSLVPEAAPGNIDATEVHDPHEFEKLDWVIAPGRFAVAENGAVWVSGRSLPHRVLLFIPQYLAIVVSRSQVVDHMHDAYARIGRPDAAFGVFVSGPSKTADIEQSLVLGAHGCRTLQVFLTP